MSQPLPSNNAEEKGLARGLLALAIAAIILLGLAFFLTRPIHSLGSTSKNLLFLLAPLDNDFAHDVWFGIDLPKEPYKGERLISLVLAALAFLALLGVGRIIVNILFKRFQLSSCERAFFASTFGYAILACGGCYAGVCGDVNLACAILLVVGLLLWIVQTIRSHKSRSQTDKTLTDSHGVSAQDSTTSAAINATSRPLSQRLQGVMPKLLACVLALFASFYVFASSQPTFEYDALEYHLQGAREIFESGKIVFSTHNVYLNMPLGAEMNFVLGLNLAKFCNFSPDNQLRIGYLVGKTLLNFQILLTAYGTLLFARRFFPKDRTASLWSALLFLSFPNLFVVASSSLNESSLALAIMAILYLLAIFLQQRTSSVKSYATLALILGVFVAFACAVKYTSVVFIALPTTLAFLLLCICPVRATLKTSVDMASPANSTEVGTYRLPFKHTCALTLLFVLIAATLGGACYLKNYRATGNPVYPLAYSIFGDSQGYWNNELNERWRRAHSASSYNLKALADAVAKTCWKDDYLSPFYLFVYTGLVIALATMIGRRLACKTNPQADAQRLLTTLCLLQALYWCAWFLLTHRLNRFLLPVSPIAALLLGVWLARAMATRSLVLRVTTFTVAAIAILYSGLLIDLIGQGRLASLTALEHDDKRFENAAIYLNDHPYLLENQNDPDNPKCILLIGDAKAAAFRANVLYSTCWNDSPLMNALQGLFIRNRSGKVIDINEPEIARERLLKMNVRFIYVDFAEIERFRSPGNYGFNNDDITRSLLLDMEQRKIIEPFEEEAKALGMKQQDISRLETRRLYRVREE
ncbi:MAG: hypothetical protein Q4G03_05690 [Planctomycetia bacterium]|nr:hypothetical protein [Planctomycetia bacterium]